MGLIQSLVVMEGVNSNAMVTYGALSADLAGSVSDQVALENMLSGFVNVFEKPGQLHVSCVWHRIDETKQPPHHHCY